MRKSSRRATVMMLFILSLFSVGLFSSCSTSIKTADPLETKAESAVEKTREDERFAPKIQLEMNGLFFQGKRASPGGLDAFSDERLAELETKMKESKVDAIQYFLENRKYFDRTEDSGGGFRIAPNGKRLVPYAKTRSGRKKLFQMDLHRVREMIANPCFSELEDCGENASDGEENTALLEEWVRKYPGAEFRVEREKVLRTYLAALGAYEQKFLKKLKPKLGKETLLLVGGHRRRISGLLGNE